MGASYKGRNVGSLGDINGTSIMPAKQFPTCGEGGLFSTDREEYLNRASMVRMFGEIVRKGQPRAYNAYTLGWNYRMNPIQAAFARSQLQRLDANAATVLGQRGSPGRRHAAVAGVDPCRTSRRCSSHVYHMFRFRRGSAAGRGGRAGRTIRPCGRGRHGRRRASSALLPEHTRTRTGDVPTAGGLWRWHPVEAAGSAGPRYDIEEYPVTLDVLEATRCIGRSGSSGPNYFGRQETIDLLPRGLSEGLGRAAGARTLRSSG